MNASSSVDTVRKRLENQRGAVLIHVALAMIGLLALSALSIDFGLKWVARAQAQNSADAGALAGAVALSFDDPNDFSDTGMAKQSALLYALGNNVIHQQPNVNVTTDITFLGPPPDFPQRCPDLSDDVCVQVDVYRNQERGNPLPTFFAGLVGVNNQGVRATATAQVRTGNATDCLRPWAILDRWDELGPGDSLPDYPSTDPDFDDPAQQIVTFDRYSTGQGNNPPQENDLYVAPTPDSAGTGFNLDRDFGRQFAIKTGDGNSTTSSGWFRAVDLPRTDTGNLGGDAYRDNIMSCNGYPTAIAAPGTVCPAATALTTVEDKVYWAARGCLRVETGNMIGPTVQGIRDLVARDLGARWIPGTAGAPGTVGGSAYSVSPRIVPISVIDINQYLQANPTGSGGVVRIVNIFGFFIEGMGRLDPDTGAIIFDPNDPLRQNADTVIGRVMTLPGMFTGSSTVDESASFLRTIILVR